MNRREATESNYRNQWRYRFIGYVSLFTFGFAWVLLMDWALRVSG